MSLPIRILVVEDDDITRAGLRLLLDKHPHFTLVGEAGDGRAAVARTMELRPAVVLMDIGLPGMDGIEATQQIKASLPDTKVVVLTSHATDDDVFGALAAGADAYCLKEISTRQLLLAIEAVAGGVAWLDPAIARRVFLAATSGARAPSGDRTNDFGLSDRELEVLSHIVKGLSNQEIAVTLHLSPETIKTHIKHIMEKLSVADRTQAAVKAIRQGLLR
ncbi:MAG TPA: response regulator transcription factor [Candidatus Obscuribacterales bacterium]